MPTQLSYKQINPRWTIGAGLGIVATAATGIVVMFTNQNAAGIDTYKELSDGSIEQSGSLLVRDSTTTTLHADVSTRRVGVGKSNPKSTLDVLGTMSGRLLTVSALRTCTLKTSSTGSVLCGTDNVNGAEVGTSALSGAIVTIGDSRYLRLAGGTMTGNLISTATISGATLRGTPGTARIAVEIFSTGSTITTGSGKMMLTLSDPAMSGSYLKSAHLSVQTAGTTNATSVQIRDASKANRKIFSTPISIDSAENGSDTAATPYVISTVNRDFGAYDRLIIDVATISTTPPKGSMQLFLEFYKP